jgi:signal transduction histidine kinase/ActR/RegA family two-component response regulator
LGPPSFFAALQRRAKFVILAFTAFVLLAVAGLQVGTLWWRRDGILRAAESRAANLALVLAEYIQGSFETADTALRQLAIHARRVGGAGAPAEAWDAILLSARSALPGSGSISVTDASGIIRRSTQPQIVGQSRRNNYLYQQLASSPRDDMVVDRPFWSPLQPGGFLIPIGRRLITPDGRFEGTVVAVVMPEAFREFFRTVDVGDRGIISVFHPDGIVLFREPSDANPIGESAAGHPLLEFARRGGIAGIYRGALEPDGLPYVSAYHSSGGTPPLIVAVSLTEHDVLQAWRRQLWASVAAFTALTLTLTLIMRVLFRQMDARAKIEQELSEIQRLEAARLRDTNERLEAALEREQRARRETEAASYLKDEFLMTVSHELRTPLTAIYGWTRMLGTDGLADDQRRRALAAVERNARAQTRLIDDLLDVSRAISGKLRLDARPVNVADVLLAAVDTLASALEAKSIRLETDIDATLDNIVLDPDRVQQIAWNLLSNAIKFTPEGGTVRLSLRRVDSNIEIVVSDTGAGIEGDFLPYVFERFRQADAGSRRRYGGLGLGLAIVRHLVELHGGTVSAESEGEGRGATFRVLLPVRSTRAEGQPVSMAAECASAHPPLACLQGVRVIVVDDEPEARELLASILGAAGATVMTASSAQEARRVLSAEGADVLVSDLEMPGEDGYELLRSLRSNAGLPRITAIAVTAYARTADRRRALEAGFDGHLARPIEPAELVALIASLAAAPADHLPGR